MVEKSHVAGFWPQLYEPFRNFGARVADWLAPASDASGDEAAYRITMELPGVEEKDIDLSVHDGVVTIKGEKSEDEKDEGREFLHRGIAERAFERRFQLADHVRPVAARTENGLLHVDLVREVPEALRPRRIEIATGRPSEATETKTIEGATE